MNFTGSIPLFAPTTVLGHVPSFDLYLKCGVRSSSGGQECYILKTHQELPTHLCIYIFQYN